MIFGKAREKKPEGVRGVHRRSADKDLESKMVDVFGHMTASMEKIAHSVSQPESVSTATGLYAGADDVQRIVVSSVQSEVDHGPAPIQATLLNFSKTQKIIANAQKKQ